MGRVPGKTLWEEVIYNLNLKEWVDFLRAEIWIARLRDLEAYSLQPKERARSKGKCREGSAFSGACNRQAGESHLGLLSAESFCVFGALPALTSTPTEVNLQAPTDFCDVSELKVMAMLSSKVLPSQEVSLC